MRADCTSGGGAIDATGADRSGIRGRAAKSRRSAAANGDRADRRQREGDQQYILLRRRARRHRWIDGEDQIDAAAVSEVTYPPRPVLRERAGVSVISRGTVPPARGA